MLEIQHGKFGENCAGLSRRTALKAGFLGALGLSSADLMRLRAEGKAARNNKSVILIWLDGGQLIETVLLLSFLQRHSVDGMDVPDLGIRSALVGVGIGLDDRPLPQFEPAN